MSSFLVSFYSRNFGQARIIRKAWNSGVRRNSSLKNNKRKKKLMKFDIYGLGKRTVVYIRRVFCHVQTAVSVTRGFRSMHYCLPACY